MAYGDEAKVQTTLVSGSVRVVLDQSDKTVLLTPGIKRKWIRIVERYLCGK